LKRGDPRQCLRHGSRLAHDFELGIGAEEVDESPPDDLMVVDEKDFHHSKALHRHRGDGGCIAHSTFCVSQISTEQAALCSVPGRADQLGDAGPLASDDQQLIERVLGEEVQGATVHGHRVHIDLGVALLPLGEATSSWACQPGAVGGHRRRECR
jgi:hypothetical protein